MDTVRWGLVGTSQINRRLIPAIRTNRQSTLVAIASRDLARAETYAHQWGLTQAHGSYQALLDSPDVDALYVGLPNALHVDVTLAAIAAGKHVLCEKPLALSPDHVDRIAAAARDRDVVVAEGFMFRHEPLTARVVRLAREGAIGALRHISAGFTYQQTRADDVRLLPELGGGSLWDVGCYPVSYARLLVGEEPDQLFGWAQNGASGVDEAFTGVLHFANGVVAEIHCGFRTAYRTWLEVLGQDGAMRVPNPFKPGVREEIEIHRGEVTRRITVEGSHELFAREVADFVTSIREGRPGGVSLDDSRGNAAALAGLHASARSGHAMIVS